MLIPLCVSTGHTLTVTYLKCTIFSSKGLDVTRDESFRFFWCITLPHRYTHTYTRTGEGTYSHTAIALVNVPPKDTNLLKPVSNVFDPHEADPEKSRRWFRIAGTFVLEGNTISAALGSIGGKPVTDVITSYNGYYYH